MAVRAGSALAAVLAPAGRALGTLGLAVLAVPAVLAAGLMTAQGTAAAATTQDGAAPVALAITSMTPQWASADSAITLTGTLRNTSGQPASDLNVRLLGSGTPVSSLAELAPASGDSGYLPVASLRGASWHTTGELAPGATVSWSVRVKAKAIGMTAFGVYPLQVQASNTLGTQLASETTYLPYEPAKKSGYARPAAEKIAWLWPLIDKPLLSAPWQSECSGAQARELARSLGAGGRLNQLLAAGQTVAGSAQAYASKAVLGRSAAGRVDRSQPAQSLASYDGVTWAIDPALLDNVRALADCGSRQPQWSRAASAWLAGLDSATAAQPVFVTPYGDPNLAALIAQGHSADVTRAFQLGRSAASRDLNRDLGLQSAGGVAATAWPSGGQASYATLESLAATDGVSSLVVASSDLPDVHTTVARAVDGGGSVNGGGSYVTLLLADDSLTQLLDSPGSGAGGAFATSQEFLAETALLAQEDPGQPIVVAPPQRWQPPAGLPGDLLTDSARAPWLSPVTLTSLTTARHIPAAVMPTTVTVHRYGRHELAMLGTLGRQISELETLKAKPSPDMYAPLFDIESSAWAGQDAVAKTMISAVSSGPHGFAAQPGNVRIVAASRITLGGLKGSVPISIDNKLGYAVQARLQLRFNQSSGLKITKLPGLVTVPADTDVPLRMQVQVTQSGSTTITVGLVDRNGNAVPTNSVRMTVQATQVGVLGMIIFAAALGVFLIASAARAVRHGRPVPAAELAEEPDHDDDHADETGAEPAGPDTVMAERTELGTARTPGL